MREAITFLKTAEIPKAMRLSASELILDTNKFIDSHISTLRNCWDNERLRQPPLERFLKVYELIKTKSYEELEFNSTIPVAEHKPEKKSVPKKTSAKRKK